ncbi:MAG: right-handed parallel beta-helix repeat-containing protein, partial [Armatimonadota bacterium]
VRTGQAEIGGIISALQLNGARAITFDNCTVRNVGGQAIGLGRETQYCRITGCTLQDLGAGGVLIGAENDAVPIGNHISHNTIENTLIAEGGRVHSSAVGIWIGQSAHNTITHNEITDFYYSAISTGWTWGYAENDNHHNTITYNHLHNLGQGVLSDMGGIYTIGMSPGTILDHNHIHDVVSYDYGGWGIYFDEGSTGIKATNNVVYNMKSSPFHQHYGTNNLLENNVLAFGNEGQILRARGSNNKSPKPETAPDKRAESSFTIRRNIIYGRKAPFFSGEWTGQNFTLADNLYWSVDPKMPARFPGSRSLAEWQAENHDSGSLVADPLCIDPAKGDFTLRAGSPATKIGFVPIDISTAGRLTGKPYKGNAPRAFPLPEAIRDYAGDDFEDSPVGDRPSGLLAIVNEEAAAPDAKVRITDETAATGKRSVKITDAAGQPNLWTPNLSYKLKLTQGVVTSHFALRLEPGAVVKHDWRDADSPFNFGPSLLISEDGTLTANGKVLTKLPQRQWISVTIRCALGTSSTGTYDLSIGGVSSAPSLEYKNLSFDSKFLSLRNWGFVSNANGPSTFYLDDLSLTVR